MEDVLPGTGNPSERTSWVRFVVLLRYSSVELDRAVLLPVLAAFLDQLPVARLVRALTYVGEGLSWSKWKGPGPLGTHLVLVSDRQDEKVASKSISMPEQRHPRVC